MAKIEFSRASELSFATTAQSLSASGATAEQMASLPLSDDEMHHLATGSHHPGSDSSPQLYEFRAEPGIEVAPHAHENAEVLYVLAGELRFGERVCGAGDSIYIPARTVYAFRAGPQGCHGLNFRGTLDQSYLTPDQVRSQRRGTEDE